MSIFDERSNGVGDEGEFVDDPRDAGGATKYGISFRWLKNVEPICRMNWVLPTTVDFQNIAQLTRDQAVLLYRHYFWNPHHYERIVDQRIANKTFDFTVNAHA